MWTWNKNSKVTQERQCLYRSRLLGGIIPYIMCLVVFLFHWGWCINLNVNELRCPLGVDLGRLILSWQPSVISWLGSSPIGLQQGNIIYIFLLINFLHNGPWGTHIHQASSDVQSKDDVLLTEVLWSDWSSLTIQSSKGCTVFNNRSSKDNMESATRRTPYEVALELWNE